MGPRHLNSWALDSWSLGWNLSYFFVCSVPVLSYSTPSSFTARCCPSRTWCQHCYVSCENSGHSGREAELLETGKGQEHKGKWQITVQRASCKDTAHLGMSTVTGQRYGWYRYSQSGYYILDMGVAHQTRHGPWSPQPDEEKYLKHITWKINILRGDRKWISCVLDIAACAKVPFPASASP